MSVKRKDTEIASAAPKRGAKVAASGAKAPSAKQPAVGKSKTSSSTKIVTAKTKPRATSAKPAKTKSRLADQHVGEQPTRVKRAKIKPPVSRPRKARASSSVSKARFAVGDVVRHRYYPFRGVIFDIDPVFANTEEWWQSIPEKMRPRKNQPFYHLLAENAETEYIAYVSEQNLMPDTSGAPIRHPQVAEYFVEDEDGRYRPVFFAMLN